MRRTWWTSLALAAVLLAGCSGDPEPREPDPSGSETPETSATPPPLPEAATQETAEGAASFVDHYLAVINYAKRSGDYDALGILSADSCTACQRLVDAVRHTSEQEGSFSGGEWSVGDLDVKQLTSVWSAAGVVATTPGYQIPESGAGRRESEGTSTQVEFQMAFDGASWRMMSLSEAVS